MERSCRGFLFSYDIYSVKGQEKLPDKSASLLIYKHFESGCQSADMWYRFDISGKVTLSFELKSRLKNRKLSDKVICAWVVLIFLVNEFEGKCYEIGSANKEYQMDKVRQIPARIAVEYGVFIETVARL